MATEARAMEYVRAHGYPVPAVEEISADGTDLVMERVYGPSMVAAMARRPWTIRRHGSVLAELHHRLHDIPAPDWLAPAPYGTGDRLLHFDLHPLNVMMTAAGPVVIDWSNTRRGDPAADVALTWVMLAAGGMPYGRIRSALMSPGREWIINGFLQRFDLAEVRRLLPGAVEWKVKDPNMTESECDAMRLLLTR